MKESKVGKERVGEASGLVNRYEEQDFCRKDKNYRTRAYPDSGPCKRDWVTRYNSNSVTEINDFSSK
jgi:hypothetical protein